MLARIHERVLIRRDRTAEAEAIDRLARAGFRRAYAYDFAPGAQGRYDIAPKKVPQAVRELAADGWRVEADGKAYRAASKFSISVSSGIDWFDLTASVNFGDAHAAMPELLRALRGYTLVSVPVPVESQRPREPSEQPFPLLQRRDLELIPELSVAVADDVLRVHARHEGNQLVVDLCVRATTADGRELYLRPTGSWSEAGPLDARTSLLLFPTGKTRTIELLQARVPAELHGAKLSAWLHNPGLRPDAPLSPVGLPVTAEL